MSFSNMLRGIRQPSQKLDRRPQTRKAASRLQLEPLEERLTPTIVFTPFFGGEQLHILNNNVLSSPPVHLIFWGGTYWGSATGQQQEQQIQSMASDLFTSAYFDDQNQYGTDGNVVLGQTAGDGSDPPQNFSQTRIEAVVKSAIDNNRLPGPFAGANQAMYVVFTPPGISSSSPTAGGYNSRTQDNGQDVVYAWIGGGATNSFVLDNYSYILSHEVSEAITDPGATDGVQVDPGASFPNPPGNSSQICDYEAQFYTLRVAGHLVQSYWSANTPDVAGDRGAFVIDDGNQYTIYANPDYTFNPVNGWTFTGTYSLVVPGHYFGPFATETIAVAAENGNSVSIQINGQFSLFEPNAVSGVNVDPGAGVTGDTIQIIQTLANVPVVINEIGDSAADAVVISPFANSLADIYGDVDIFGSEAANTLEIDAQSDPSFTYSLTGGIFESASQGGAAITFDGNVSAVSITGPQNFASQYTIVGTVSPSTTLNTFLGSVDVIQTGTGTTLNLVDYGITGDEIEGTGIGSTCNISAPFTSLGSVVVTGTGADSALDINGSLSAPIGIQGLGAGSVCDINVGSLASGFINVVGTGPNAVLNISTHIATTITVYGLARNSFCDIVSHAFDSIEVGNGNAQGVLGTLEISTSLVDPDSLDIDDSGDFTSHNVTITGGFVSGIVPGAIEYGSYSLNTLSIEDSFVPSTYSVLSTPAPFMIGPILVASTAVILNCNGADTINVGFMGTLGGVVSPLTVNGSFDQVTLNLDDHADAAGHNVAFNGSDIVNFAPAQINYGQYTLGALNINGSTGGSTYNVQGTPAPYILNGIFLDPSTTTITCNGKDAVNVGSGGSVQTILGTLVVVGFPTEMDPMNIDDSADPAARSVTLTANAISGLAPGVIEFADHALGSLNVEGSLGGSSYAVQGTALPTYFGFGKNRKILFATPTTLTCNGADNVLIGNATDGIGDILSDLTILGTNGASTLTVDDSAGGGKFGQTTAVQTFISGGQAELFGDISPEAQGFTVPVSPASIEYELAGIGAPITIDVGQGFLNRYDILGTGAQGLDLNTGPGSTDVDVQSISGPLNITGQGGDDTVVLSSGLAAQVAIANAAGSTQLVLDDSADAVGQVATITNSSVSGLSPLPMALAGFGSLNLILEGGSGGNTFNVLGTASTTSLDIDAGAGGDTVNLGNPANQLADVQGPTTIDAADGVTSNITVVVNDQGSASGQTFAVTPTSITPSAAGPITIANLQLLTIHAGSGNDTFDLAGPAPMFLEVLTGGSGSNTLSGPDGPDNWRITGLNAGSVGNVRFRFIQNLAGGAGDNTFRFQSGGRLTGSIAGGTGNNTLNYAAFAAPVTVNLQSQTATGVAGFSNIQGVVGCAGLANTLTGADTDNTWSISGTNAGTINGAFTFSSMPNLVGGAGVDIFQFGLGKGITGNIDGGGAPAGEGNWLDYSARPFYTTVDLTAGTASAVGGTVSNIQNVIGGSFGDKLTGGPMGSILVGGSGKNFLFGEAGRNVLIGGLGNGQISGGPGEDILIGGSTVYDGNEAALMSILAEWDRTDITLAQRVADLRNGAGLNGDNVLTAGTTVLDAASVFLLSGNPAAQEGAFDWFFKGPGDKITDRVPGDPLN